MADTTEAPSEGRLESAGDDAAPAADDGGADLAEEAAAPWVMAPEEFFATIADLVRSGDFTPSEQLQRDFDAETGFQDVATCVESAGLLQFELVGVATNISEDQDEATATEYLVVIPEGVEVGPDTQVTFISVMECEVAHVEN